MLAFSKDTLLAPLTTLPTSDIEKLALELDKSIQMFTTIQVRSYDRILSFWDLRFLSIFLAMISPSSLGAL